MDTYAVYMLCMLSFYLGALTLFVLVKFSVPESKQRARKDQWEIRSPGKMTWRFDTKDAAIAYLKTMGYTEYLVMENSVAYWRYRQDGCLHYSEFVKLEKV